MSRPSLNAFKGYSYQQNIFMFFVAKMDIERNINSISAEIICNHNFDDICLRMNNYDSIVVQTKNYKDARNIEIKNDKVIINDNESLISPNEINLFIVENYDIEENSTIFDLPAYKEKNVYIISLSIDDIYNILLDSYKEIESRFNQIIHISASKCVQDDNSISIEELPPIRFFSSELLEQTIKIRDFQINNKEKTIFIIGKPGVGKSHLVSELGFSNHILYRFWVSEQDPNKNDRLQFANFIKQLSADLFGDLKIHSIEEILSKMKDDNKIIVVDGLDHIENYNNIELEQYIDFFASIHATEKIKLLVLTRPLRTVDFDYNKIILNDWDESETFTFLEEVHCIKDYLILKQIYKKSKGYPIITDYLAKHYIINNELPAIEDLKDVNDYYKKLISNVHMEKTLTVFSLTRSYITYDELKGVFGDIGLLPIVEFLETHKYLFEIKLNRISLIHDSFNTFLIKEVGINDTIKEKFYNFVKQSIGNFEVRFLSRIDSLILDNDYKKYLLNKYVSFDIFEKLVSLNIDYESIKYFYQKLNTFLQDIDENALSIYQYYDFILILNILGRDNIEQRHSMLFQMFNYLTQRKFNEDVIFSNGTLFGFYNAVYKKDFSIYTRYIKDKNYSLDSVFNEFDKQLSKEKDFFKILSENITEKDLEELEARCMKKENEELNKKNNFTELLVLCYVSKINFKNYRDIILKYINNNQNDALYDLEKIFLKNGIRGFMARWSLNQAFDRIKQLGFEKDTNDYLNLSLKEFIKKYAKEGSFDVGEMITSYIRLANKNKREIDILSIGEYFTMYYRRKDYTALTFSNAFKVFYSQKMISLKKCIEYIIVTKEMSEKGIRHILDDFVNMLNSDEIKDVEKMGYFDNDDINIDNLNNTTLITINKKYMLNALYEYIYNARNSYVGDYFIYYYDIDKFINSDYRNEVCAILNRFGCTIYDIPQHIKIDYDRVQYKKDEYKRESKYAYDEGYLVESEYEYIKSKGISHLDLSKMLDGWYHSLPFTSLFKMYEYKVLKKDILKIIYNTLAKSKNKYNSNGEIDLLIGNIVELLHEIEYPLEWNRLFNSFTKFLEISQIRIEKSN